MDAQATMRMKNPALVGGVLVSLLVAVVLAATMALPSVAEAKTYKISTAKQWSQISKYNGGTFKLTKNITLKNEKQYLTISKNKKYVIDLNGHKIVTSYKGVALRTASPLFVKKGTVIIKSSKANKGVFYGTETATVTLAGNSKFYLKSGTIVNNATEFRSDITSAIYVSGKAKCYIQGKSKIRSIGNGIAVLDSGKLYVTGNPYIRAGANEYKGQFTHYGSAISIASSSAKLSIKGGSFGTKASPDVNYGGYSYAMSANYPVLDMYGKALKTASGYKYIDAKRQTVTIKKSNLNDVYDGNTGNSSLNEMFKNVYGYYPTWDNMLAQYGMSSEKRLTTTVKSSDGYYTVYCVKK